MKNSPNDTLRVANAAPSPPRSMMRPLSLWTGTLHTTSTTKQRQTKSNEEDAAKPSSSSDWFAARISMERSNYNPDANIFRRRNDTPTHPTTESSSNALGRFHAAVKVWETTAPSYFFLDSVVFLTYQRLLLNGLFRRIDNVADVLFWRLVVLDPWTPLLQFLGCCCFKRAGPSPTNKKSLRVVTTRNQNDPGRMLKESIDIFLCDNNNSDSSEEDDDTESDCSTTTMEQQATPTAASPTDLEFGFSGSWEEDANNWVTMIRQTSSTSSQTANRISPVSTIGSLAMKMDLISGLWEEESKKVLLLSTSSDSTTTIVSPTASSLDSPLSGSWDAESSIVSWASLQPSPTASSPTTTRSSGVGLSGVSWQDELLRVEISSGTSPAAAVTTTTFGFGMSGSWDEESNVVSSSMISQSPKASSSRTAVANVSVERKSGSWVEKAIPLVPWFGEASPPGLSGSWDEKLNIVTLQLPFDTEHQQLYTDDMNDRSSDVDPATMVETAIASLAAFDACMSGTWEEEAHIVLRWQTLDRSSRNEALESMVDVTYGSFASFVSERIEV